MRTLTLFLLLFPLIFSAQKKEKIPFEVVVPNLPKKEFKKLDFPSYLNNENELGKATRELILQLNSLSYLLAELDSVVWKEEKYMAYFNPHKPFQWVALKSGNAESDVIHKTNYKEKLFTASKFKPKQIGNLFESIIQYYENHGFPFVSVGLDSVEFLENGIKASLNITKNKFYKIDSLIISGDAKVSESFIANYLSIKEGSAYNESEIKKIDTRIKNLPFVEAFKPAELIFTKEDCELTLFLKKKKASRFNGILGFQPDQNGKIRFTGDIELKLLNGFGHGEEIFFNWRNLSNQTQDLDVKFVYPYLLGTPLGFDYHLDLYKRDSSFLDVKNNIGFRYLFSANNYLKFVYTAESSNTLIKQTAFSSSLPELNDVKVNAYGLGVHLEKLDYKLNPRKGFSLDFFASTGFKKIILPTDTTLLENFKDIETNSTRYKAEVSADFFFPIYKRLIGNYGIRSAIIENSTIFKNELYRIGGFKTLRGFDEESIFASFYAVNTFELRFILEQNSYLFAFTDVGYWENNATALPATLHYQPTSFGGGIAFDSKVGIFSLTYAIGNEFNNTFLIRSAKIHFGFVNYF